MMELWNGLNGKKTTIGALVFFVAMLLSQVGWVDQNTLDLLNKVAEIVVGVGLIHKVKKNM